MILHAQPGPPVYGFPALHGLSGFAHGIFGRRGGVSAGPYESLNLGERVGDDPRAVAENRARAAAALGGPVAFARQVHETGVLRVDGAPAGAAWECQGEADALVTDRRGVFLAVLLADCQGILLADPVRRAVGAVHSGWRGSVANIAAKAVEAMAREYGCRPGDLAACVSPSLGPCCAQFVNYRDEIPETLWTYRREENRFDFWAMTTDQLSAAGLSRENIHLAGVCTKCRSGEFFSFRAARPTGRFAAAIGMVP
ncbi:MAG: peptidoglycan editing factor PgeF [Deltaproteobacteria bacterium]|nr:peptidoglycan editing factor PgeF [Deltaproteobacteria bacterium]